MKTLGINIDGVIRDFHGQFDKQYRKVFIHNPGLVAMDEETHSFKAYTQEEEKTIEQKMFEKERELITLPIDSFELLNHYKFDSKTTQMTKLDIAEDVNYMPIEFTPKQNLDNFLYEEYPFQIFGAANEYSGAMEAINKIQSIGLTSGSFQVILLHTLKSKAIAATYSFLGKANCRIRKIAAVDSDSEKWSMCDVIVDVMPAVFQTKPADKTSIKINHLFNQWDKADYSFESIKEMANKDILDRIFNNKE
jgi:hypothetical protein